MSEIINESTIVTIFAVEMDYVYCWGLKVPIVDALGEISKRQKEECRTGTYHVCLGDTGLDRICSISMNNVRLDEDDCFPDVQTVAALLTQKGALEFNICDETWSQEKSMLLAGLPRERIDRLLNGQ